MFLVLTKHKTCVNTKPDFYNLLITEETLSLTSLFILERISTKARRVEAISSSALEASWFHLREEERCKQVRHEKDPSPEESLNQSVFSGAYKEQNHFLLHV